MQFMRHKLKAAMIMAALSVLLLTACGETGIDGQKGVFAPKPEKVTFTAGEFTADATTLTLALEPGECALLDKFTLLESADLSGSADFEEVCAWAAAHPDIAVRYTVPLPTGETVAGDADSVDLSTLSGQDIPEAVRCLSCLPKLRLIALGQERGDLSWAEIKQLTDAFPEADIDFEFTLYGKSFRLADTRMDLNHISIEDGGALVLSVASCMPELRYLDMDSCGVSNEEMAFIRDSLPDTKVVWRVWFGDAYSVRTDVEKILASKPSVGGELVDTNTEALKYCTDVKYLDLGHNTSLTDVSFVSYMPKLEVCILAMLEYCTDFSPLGDCPELEYLEIFSTPCGDISFLANSQKLRHLDLLYMPNLTDISPLYGLHDLERLWLNGYTPVPPEQIEQMQKAAPDCEINTEGSNRWQYVDYNDKAYLFILHPRYELLREQFGYDEMAYSFYWNDPLYYAQEG